MRCWTCQTPTVCVISSAELSLLSTQAREPRSLLLCVFPGDRNPHQTLTKGQHPSSHLEDEGRRPKQYKQSLLLETVSSLKPNILCTVLGFSHRVFDKEICFGVIRSGEKNTVGLTRWAVGRWWKDEIHSFISVWQFTSPIRYTGSSDGWGLIEEWSFSCSKCKISKWLQLLNTSTME